MSLNPMDVSYHAQERLDRYREETRLAGLRNANVPRLRERAALVLHSLAVQLDKLAGRLAPREHPRVRHGQR